MMSSFDRWITKEGPDWSPMEIGPDDYGQDEDLQALAPFDETRCNGPLCDEDAVMIGAYLRMDPETTADIPTYQSFWMMDEDGEKLFCEDCFLNVTEEICDGCS